MFLTSADECYDQQTLQARGPPPSGSSWRGGWGWMGKWTMYPTFLTPNSCNSWNSCEKFHMNFMWNVFTCISYVFFLCEEFIWKIYLKFTFHAWQFCLRLLWVWFCVCWNCICLKIRLFAKKKKKRLFSISDYQKCKYC